MKRGFTLIELIFVIVIIGILSAFAIPKYQDLRANAKLNSLVKIVADIASNAEASVLNMKELNGKTFGEESNATMYQLSDIIKIEQGGKDWDIATANEYKYKTDAIEITLNDTNMTIELDCSKGKIVDKEDMEDKCKERFGGTFTGNKRTINLKF